MFYLLLVWTKCSIFIKIPEGICLCLKIYSLCLLQRHIQYRPCADYTTPRAMHQSDTGPHASSNHQQGRRIWLLDQAVHCTLTFKGCHGQFFFFQTLRLHFFFFQLCLNQLWAITSSLSRSMSQASFCAPSINSDSDIWSETKEPFVMLL